MNGAVNVMTKKYFVELRDKLHIVTAEKMEREGEEPELRMLKPREDDAFGVEGENYQAYWLWLKDEKSFLPGEALDFCFLYPPALSPAPLIEAAACLEARIAEKTELHVGDARCFFRLTGRDLEEVTSDGEKTLLCTANGTKVYAMSIGGKGLAAEREKPVEALKQEDIPAPKYAVRRRERARPKAFTAAQGPAKPNAMPVLSPQKTRQDGQSVKAPIEAPPPIDPALPKATAADIQIGIKRITEGQCQDVDFRD